MTETPMSGRWKVCWPLLFSASWHFGTLPHFLTWFRPFSFSPIGTEWKPKLVILQINRAATCAQWSPNELKFAVGSGSKTVAVCYYEEDNDWWVSRQLKKHQSSVLSVNFHPENALIATGCADNCLRIFSTWSKATDKVYVASYFYSYWLDLYHSIGWSKMDNPG